jgi:DNA-binding FadR family transcriptional regulator
MLIAERIVKDALKAGVKPGDMLPAERTMLERYETARGTLREALRLLEFQGAVVLKPGPTGGPILQRPNPANLASALVLIMELNSAPFRTVVEMRFGLEPIISRLAAARMSDEDLKRLGGLNEQMRKQLNDRPAFFDANRRFHDLIAWSSGNTLFGYLVESLLGIVDGQVMGIDYPLARRRAILKAHEAIFEALSARSPEAAEQSMKDHLIEYIRYAEKTYPDLLDRVIPWARGAS